MEDKGKIKVSLGVLVLIVLIVIIISVGATYLVLQKVNQDKQEKKEEQNTVTNSVQNLVKNEVKNQVKNEVENEVNDPKNVVATGAFNHMKVISEGYTIDINSEEVGHPDSKSLFRTGFEIENEDGTTETFNVSYDKVVVYGKDAVLSTSLDQPITIGGKKYSYTTEDKHETVLKYHIEDENLAYLCIKVRGMEIFDKDGNDTGKTPIIDKDVLESEELGGILDLEVGKE